VIEDVGPGTVSLFVVVMPGMPNPNTEQGGVISAGPSIVHTWTLKTQAKQGDISSFFSVPFDLFLASSEMRLAAGAVAGTSAPYLFNNNNGRLLETFDIAEAARMKGNGYVPMMNQAETIKWGLSGALRFTSYTLGTLGVINTGYLWSTGKIGGTKAVLDISFGIAGSTTLIGSFAAGAYFIGSSITPPPQTYRDPRLVPSDATRYLLTPRPRF
jgi:hypothetical protein